ncbi:MAG: ATP-binding protein, partial [Actinomycetota bacterium]
QLDTGFFRARWDRATPAERAYLTAMAVDGDGPSSSGEVAKRIDKKPTSLGPARANLIAKGIIYTPEHGQIAFTVPGMANFIDRHSVRNGGTA